MEKEEREKAHIDGQVWAWRLVLADALKHLRELGAARYPGGEGEAIRLLAEQEYQHVLMVGEIRTQLSVVAGDVDQSGELWAKMDACFEGYLSEVPFGPREPSTLLEELQACTRHDQLSVLMHIFPHGWRHPFEVLQARLSAAQRLCEAVELLQQNDPRNKLSEHERVPDHAGLAAARVVLKIALEDWKRVAPSPEEIVG